MGIHSLTSMATVNGCFVCQPDWSSAGALQLIAGERLTALYLIPTLFWELIHAPELTRTEIPKTASGKILRRLLRDGQYTEVRP